MSRTRPEATSTVASFIDLARPGRQRNATVRPSGENTGSLSTPARATSLRGLAAADRLDVQVDLVALLRVPSAVERQSRERVPLGVHDRVGPQRAVGYECHQAAVRRQRRVAVE
jgi:hypothetical protein